MLQLFMSASQLGSRLAKTKTPAFFLRFTAQQIVPGQLRCRTHPTTEAALPGMWRGSAAIAAVLSVLLASCCRAARLSSPGSVLFLPGSQQGPKPPVYPASFEVHSLQACWLPWKCRRKLAAAELS